MGGGGGVRRRGSTTGCWGPGGAAGKQQEHDDDNKTRLFPHSSPFFFVLLLPLVAGNRRRRHPRERKRAAAASCRPAARRRRAPPPRLLLLMRCRRRALLRSRRLLCELHLVPDHLECVRMLLDEAAELVHPGGLLHLWEGWGRRRGAFSFWMDSPYPQRSALPGVWRRRLGRRQRCAPRALEEAQARLPPEGRHAGAPVLLQVLDKGVLEICGRGIGGGEHSAAIYFSRELIVQAGN